MSKEGHVACGGKELEAPWVPITAGMGGRMGRHTPELCSCWKQRTRLAHGNMKDLKNRTELKGKTIKEIKSKTKHAIQIYVKVKNKKNTRVQDKCL